MVATSAIEASVVAVIGATVAVAVIMTVSVQVRALIARAAHTATAVAVVAAPHASAVAAAMEVDQALRSGSGVALPDSILRIQRAT